MTTTSFTYGDPKVSPATLTTAAKFVGPAFPGTGGGGGTTNSGYTG